VGASFIASVVAAIIFTWLFCGFDSSSELELLMNTTWCPHLETDNVALNLQVGHLAPFQKNHYLSPYVQQLPWTIEQSLWYSLAVMKIWFLKLWSYTMYWAMANLRSKPEVVRTSCHLFTGTSKTNMTETLWKSKTMFCCLKYHFTLEFGKTQHQDLLLGMEIITLDNFAL
jgi:hypothetical protein